MYAMIAKLNSTERTILSTLLLVNTAILTFDVFKFSQLFA